MIKTVYSLSEPEFIEAQMLVMRYRRPWEFHKRWIYILALTFALIILVPGTIILLRAKLTHDPRIGLSGLFLSEGWILLFICLFELQLAYSVFDLLTLRSVKRKMRKHFVESRSGQTDVHLTVDDSGWLDQSPHNNSSTLVHWAGFSGWTESASLFVLLRPGVMFHILPKRVLADSELTQVHQLIASHLGPSSASTRRH